ncbi:MAG: hypothetical protein J0L73_14210 [Verrucomicrobia bacterium]|nr:hypothetical protein [Verrucomicrobiota bacterium]
MGIADLGKVAADFIKNSPQLIAAIALMGGAGGAMKAHHESSSGAEQTQVDASQKTDDTGSSSASDQSSSTTTAGRPSTPPLSVEQSQKLIHNVMNRPVEQRGHPTTQADLAQAQWVVREQVRKLESQKEPLNESQEKALADAKAALARVEQPDTTTGLPDEPTILDVGGAAGHGKKMDPWDNNPNDQKRTVPEAVEIFRNNFKEFMQLYGKKLGVNINPQLINQINFVPNSTIPAENGQRKWAAYRPNALGTGIKGEHTWNDFLKDGKITVEIDPEVLKSDQAIVGIFAHELLELHGIKDMMETNTNRSLPKEKLQQLIMRWTPKFGPVVKLCDYGGCGLG